MCTADSEQILVEPYNAIQSYQTSTSKMEENSSLLPYFAVSYKLGSLLHVFFLYEINHDNGTVKYISSHLNTT